MNAHVNRKMQLESDFGNTLILQPSRPRCQLWTKIGFLVTLRSGPKGQRKADTVADSPQILCNGKGDVGHAGPAFSA
uniref:Uncharacterized protein n=1 Tax=Coccidioides posadasii RMSCC 3488 TaxID=454284 RepID=A0A0J6FW01_COCPO|nr:hypothetical protein CPAG_09663 [Coccidioides posadasii RMSCC 3488]